MVNRNNRRSFARIPAPGLAAYLRLEGKSAGCEVENISPGGLFVATDRVIPVGNNLSLDLVRPGMDKAIPLTARVVGIRTKDAAAKRSKSPGLRLRFHRLEPEVALALQELLQHLGAPTVQPQAASRARARGTDPQVQLSTRLDLATEPPPSRADPDATAEHEGASADAAAPATGAPAGAPLLLELQALARTLEAREQELRQLRAKLEATERELATAHRLLDAHGLSPTRV